MKMVIQAYAGDDRRPVEAGRLYNIVTQLQKEHETASRHGFEIFNDFGRLLLGSKITKDCDLIILEGAEKTDDKLFFYDLAAKEMIILRLV